MIVTLCLPRSAGAEVTCEEVSGAVAYHDHNWGVWRDVSWEWGAASDDELSLLFGTVRVEGGTEPGLFAYLVDERGVRGLFRPPSIRFPDTVPLAVDGGTVLAPRTIEFEDARRGLRVRIEIETHHVTTLERDSRPHFVQMRGVANVQQAGHPPRRLPGFFETYVD